MILLFVVIVSPLLTGEFGKSSRKDEFEITV